MVERAEVSGQTNEEIMQLAARRAGKRAKDARWDLNIAVFLFAVLIIVIILLFQGIELEIVAPVALFGLAMVWLVGWRQGRQLYQGFYQEELVKLKRDLARESKQIEETIEEKVQKALQNRWR